jgi:hypothetical protein
MPRGRTLAWIAGGVAWIAAVIIGLAALMAYDNRPGAAAEAPAAWPADADLAADRQGPTLLMFAHPRCDCTRASLDELAELLARAAVRPRAYVVFLKPGHVAGGWEQTGIWRRAAAIPGVTVVRDDQGAEARRFGVRTSGQVLVYGRAGRLLYSGGTTGARGKTGNNVGRAAILAALEADRAQATAPVFGCSMFDTTDSERGTDSHVDPLPVR